MLIAFVFIPLVLVTETFVSVQKGVEISDTVLPSLNLDAILQASVSALSTQSNNTKNNITKRTDNPHWKKGMCKTCHKNKPKSLLTRMKSAEHEKLCLECHADDLIHAYIHPVNIVLPESRKVKIINSWTGQLRLNQINKITCLTCHDILDQCLPERSYQAERNPGFLRGGPYSERYSMCFKCHNQDQYVRTNPHDQINKDRVLKTKMCRLCHVIDTNKIINTGVEKVLDNFPLLEGMNEDRSTLCIRCHKKIDHPSSAFRIHSNKKFRHLGVISGDKKETLLHQNTKTGVILPIEPGTGRIYCGTCHQPHQPGVFKGERPGSIKMKSNRLRAKPICKHCHAIYGDIIDDGVYQ